MAGADVSNARWRPGKGVCSAVALRAAPCGGPSLVSGLSSATGARDKRDSMGGILGEEGQDGIQPRRTIPCIIPHHPGTRQDEKKKKYMQKQRCRKSYRVRANWRSRCPDGGDMQGRQPISGRGRWLCGRKGNTACVLPPASSPLCCLALYFPTCIFPDSKKTSPLSHRSSVYLSVNFGTGKARKLRGKR